MDRPKILLRAVRETLQNYGVGLVCGIVLLFFVPSCLRCCVLYLGGVVFLATVIGPLVNDWRPRRRSQPAGKAVFISGCDSGFGHLLAQKLDDLGYHVFAGCLLPEADGATNLKKTASTRLHVVPLDVTQQDSIQKAKEYVVQNIKDNKLWAVVSNAGINDGGELLWTNVDILQRVMDVNAFGVVRVTKAFLPLLCRSKGRVVAVASAAGRYTYPGMVSYCMSKQSVVSFCDGLRLEMYRFGVKVITVEPWMYKTQITNKENILSYIAKTWNSSPEEYKEFFAEGYLERYKKQIHKFITWSISDKPEEVVSCLEEAVTAINPKYSYMPGTLFSRLTFWVLRRLPKPIADLAVNDHCAVKTD